MLLAGNGAVFSFDTRLSIGDFLYTIFARASVCVCVCVCV